MAMALGLPRAHTRVRQNKETPDPSIHIYILSNWYDCIFSFKRTSLNYARLWGWSRQAAKTRITALPLAETAIIGGTQTHQYGTHGPCQVEVRGKLVFFFFILLFNLIFINKEYE